MRYINKSFKENPSSHPSNEDDVTWLKNQGVVPYHTSESYVGTLVRNDIKQLFILLNNEENPESSEHASHITSLIHRLESKLANEPNMYLTFRLLFLSVTEKHIHTYPVVKDALIDNKLTKLYEKKLEHYRKKSYTAFEAWLQDINNYYLYQLHRK